MAFELVVPAVIVRTILRAVFFLPSDSKAGERLLDHYIVPKDYVARTALNEAINVSEGSRCKFLFLRTHPVALGAPQ